MSQDYRSMDPDDFFADTRMSFGDHIEDLRVHLFRAAFWFVGALIFSFFIGRSVLKFISKPVEVALEEYHERRQEQMKENINSEQRLINANKQSQWFEIEMVARQVEAGDNGRPVPQIKKEDLANEPTVRMWARYPNSLDALLAPGKATLLVGRKIGLSTLSVTEAFMAYVKICIVCAFILGSPGIFYQLWMFVAAGLYPNERRYVHRYVPFSVVLFLVGVAACEWFVIPKAISALLWFNEWLSLEPDLRFSEWLGFAILLPLVFGLAFQTPIVVIFLARLGIVTTDSMRGKRKFIWFGMAVTSAVITPQDIYSMIFLLIPLCLLFEIGIWVADRTAPPPLEDEGENEDLIEV